MISKLNNRNFWNLIDIFIMMSLLKKIKFKILLFKIIYYLNFDQRYFYHIAVTILKYFLVNKNE